MERVKAEVTVPLKRNWLHKGQNCKAKTKSTEEREHRGKIYFKRWHNG